MLPPGASLDSFILHLFAQAPPDTWKQFFEALKTPFEDGEEGWWAGFSALGPEDLPFYFVVEAHSFGLDQTQGHLRIAKVPKPESAVPDFIIEDSRKVGGYPYFMGAMARAWNAGEISVRTDIGISIPTRMLHSDHQATLDESPTICGFQASRRSVSWAIDDEGANLKSLTLSRTDDDRVSISSRSRPLAIPLTSDLIEVVEELICTMLMSFATKS